jgi:hypothetical protein
MRGVQISYLIEHPEYIQQLAQWQFEEWDSFCKVRNHWENGWCLR